MIGSIIKRWEVKVAFPDVEHLDRCWIWLGAKSKGGYGQIWYNRRIVMAHRWAYEFFIGPIPENIQTDHLCRFTSCVNPYHLEIVTQEENLRRSKAWQSDKWKNRKRAISSDG